MHEKGFEKKEKEYGLAHLSEEQRDLLDKVEKTTGLILVAYDNNRDMDGVQTE
ncbi:hypothetical protein [Virgibacillus sp. DJP39]|uniref:hypothetical protein n=1 Tax=Virgibacillus sp. DJP39 TaxID=3409790 RepID=UPI003BB4928D